ncbi:hypothetical protein CU098_004873 [Rhizopus stolonifer]|uniref:GATA-type domain-containing protein n=1 Tax=Rhizopus stolonifer TaxID=4846 RepID=A0A367IWU3_RHIST|nr:hypothetical protein CU098_004873 [Rhizopus stolonifer]
MTKTSFIEQDIPIHIKIIGRHLNGSFRCHIGTSKASRPIKSTELDQQMRLLTVFFRTENAKSQYVSPDFIFFPTWLLHLFKYTQHNNTPGRTDVRFLENANMAKDDHIYRLNHVLNSLFRFNIHHFDPIKLVNVIELANYLFDHAGLEYIHLPRPSALQPKIYASLLSLLKSPRPTKTKPMCLNCNTKTASRRRLCVACYRYQLKHNAPRPLRLIVANLHEPRLALDYPKIIYTPVKTNEKICANCNVKKTHQWYRNLCGLGHWCETCKSYYLRHNKIRPQELFIKAAKRKVDVRSLVTWSDRETPSPSESSLDSPTAPPASEPYEPACEFYL